MGFSQKYGELDVGNEDEPVFVFRGQDAIAPAAIRHYVHLCSTAGLDTHAAQAEKALHVMEAWQNSNADLVRQPDSEPPEDEDAL